MKLITICFLVIKESGMCVQKLYKCNNNNNNMDIQCVPEKTKPRIIDDLSYLNRNYNK